jgi:hypothetical protein
MSFFSKKNKVAPISLRELRYYDLLRTINSGNLLTEDEMSFVRELPKENILVVVKLYNINLFNNIKNRNNEIIVEFV